MNVTIQELPDYSTVTDESGVAFIPKGSGPARQLTLVLHSININQVSKRVEVKPNETLKFSQVVSVKQSMLSTRGGYKRQTYIS